MIFRTILLILLFLFSEQLLSQVTQNGWNVYSNYSEYYSGGKKVFDTRDKLQILPQGLTEEMMVEFGLSVGEYYISKQDKEGLSHLIYLLRKDAGDYKLLDFLLTFFWKYEKGEYKEAENKLKDFIDTEDDKYQTHIAKMIYLFLRKKQDNFSISHKDVTDFSCSSNKKYFSFCRVLKLRSYLEFLNSSNNVTSREYSNLDRLLAPFFEEKDLSFIPFIEVIAPELAPRLAYLGFASEAVHFQKITMISEALLGKSEIISAERLSFYHMLQGDLVAAEKVLDEAMKNLRPIAFIRNNLLLKMGMIAYIRKDYKSSYNYLTKLDFKYWGKTLKNPITDETINVNGARDLLSIVIWKARSPAIAIKALDKLSSSRPDEEELFIKLRIAHIIFKERPQAAEKMTDDIIYTAQSKGWKRVEYAATLLNGYTNIINKKYRKAVIQFTKSYGILGNTESSSKNEWIRQSGMLLARISAKERGAHSKSFDQLLKRLNSSPEDTEIMMIKNFLDERYGVEGFENAAINHFLKYKDYDYLLSTLYYHNLRNVKSGALEQKSVLQVSPVEKRIQLYKGFRPSLDNIYYKGNFSKFRREYTLNLASQNENFLISDLTKATIPILAIFPFQNQYFAVSYHPNSKTKWDVQIFNSTEYNSSLYYKRLAASFSFVESDESFQIYFNREGMDFFRYLKSQRKGQNAILFYNFKSDSSHTKDLALTGADCTNSSSRNSNVDYVSSEYFQGNKAFENTRRFHVWSFPEVGISSQADKNKLESYYWKCNSSETLRVDALYRRADVRMIPHSILFVEPVLPASTVDSPTNEMFEWSDFWMKKGTNRLFALSKFGNDFVSDQALKILSANYLEVEDISKLQNLFASDARGNFILLRGLK
jgi:hypothetical protein